ncbi:MAG: permease [Acidimicrobiales bacterium]|jgi:uncharacterized membrane protein YraQ (UPF0718 family)/YHS domain-containing protein
MTGAALLAGLGWVDAVGRSLREGFFMFWETLWALVFGFTLAGAVQAFVSRDAMQAKMGDHAPAAVARAAGYGMASSSCSYAASAMAKSLFVKGADFVSAMVFMVASTNLVIELGAVLIVLMGWQFAASEFVGGVLMIVLLATLGGLWLRGKLVVQARLRLGEEMSRRTDQARSELAASDTGPWSERLRSRQGWVDAASYTVADLTMLRRELALGFVAAGFLTVLVPVQAWNALFVHGHGTLTNVENVLVGPLIALLSCVCSIGNVPLAAALWKGGISFGGVVSFLFADLISLPLLFVYRRYYGTRLMARMLLLFWGLMSVVGLVTEVIFRAAGLVPRTRPVEVAAPRFAWSVTSYLDIVALGLFAVLYLIYRRRDQLGNMARYAIDPVCGMQVEVANAPAFLVHDGERFQFCCDRCRARFEADPARFLASRRASGTSAEGDGQFQ